MRLWFIKMDKIRLPRPAPARVQAEAGKARCH
jgi:hypothetical protein